MAKDTDMQILSKVAAETGVSKHTLRWWSQTGRIPAERRENERGVLSWYTTVEAVQAALNNPKIGGRPVKIGR